MNWEQIENKWKQFRGQAKQQWPDLTDSDLDQIDGKHDVLTAKLQQRYGILREDAQRKVEEWLKALDRQSPMTQQESHQAARG